MKKIVYIIIGTIIFLSIICLSVYYIKKNNKGNDNAEVKIIFDEKESEENEPITDIIENNDITSENESSSDDTSSKNNMEVNTTTNSNVVRENKTNTTTNTNTAKPKEEPKQEQSSPPVVEQPKPKEKTPWEELGISEYDYYNKPMWSWVSVTYSVKIYGSETEARKQCQLDCDNSGRDCRCITVNSYSGDYLGEYLKINN